MTATTKVLVLSRLFNGLAESIESGVWRPTGVPAIYKLLEALADDRSIDLTVAFLCRDGEAGARFASVGAADISRLRGPARVIAWRGEGAWGELRQLVDCLRLFREVAPDVVYVTNAAFVAGSVISRFTRRRAILRIMGLFPIHKQLADARFSLARWLYRAPWDHVVATEEGSGSQVYLPRLLAPGTRLSVWLNGVDLTPPEAEAVVRTKRAHGLDQRPIVLWLGRLESYKGCAEFVEAMVILFRRRPGLGKAVVIGGGSMETELRAQVAEAGRETDILLVGAVAHPEVAAWLAAAEVYVSLNRNGNLSNANLEAMRAGCAMVWLGADPETHTDVETLRLVPEEIVPRVRRWRMVEDTVEIVEALLDDEGRRRSHKAAVRGLADRLLCDWDTRIGRELDLIKGVTPAGGQAFEYQGSGGQRVCT